MAKDGTLPVTFFGRPLNFKRAKKQGIKWLICVAEKDDLVEKESALTPTEWVDAEVAVFPKGHVAIATSWSMPATECSLDKCFLDYRGPVRFHMDLEAEADKIQAAAAQKVSRDKARLEADLKAGKGKRPRLKLLRRYQRLGTRSRLLLLKQAIDETRVRRGPESDGGQSRTPGSGADSGGPTQSAWGQKAEKNRALADVTKKPET